MSEVPGNIPAPEEPASQVLAQRRAIDEVQEEVHVDLCELRRRLGQVLRDEGKELVPDAATAVADAVKEEQLVPLANHLRDMKHKSESFRNSIRNLLERLEL